MVSYKFCGQKVCNGGRLELVGGISVSKRGFSGRNRVTDLKKVCICTQILNPWLFFRCDRGDGAKYLEKKQ